MLGKFAALAVADSVVITSIYEGEKVQYLMYKQGLSIQIDEISATTTTEHNGVEILVYISVFQLDNLRRKFMDVAGRLCYFDNLYMTTDTTGLKSYVDRFNRRKLKDFNTFSICFIPAEYRTGYDTMCFAGDEAYIRYGNVMYPVDKEKINLSENIKWLFYNPIGIRIPIGELDVTPNRENLLYSQRTIDAIQKRAKDVHNELIEIINNKFTGELTGNVARDLLYVTSSRGLSQTTIKCSDRWSWPEVTLSETEKIPINIKVPGAIIAKSLNNLTYKDVPLTPNLLAGILYIFESFPLATTMMDKKKERKHFSTTRNITKSFREFVFSINNRDGWRKWKYGLWSENLKSATKEHLEQEYKDYNFAIIRNDFKDFKKCLFDCLRTSTDKESYKCRKQAAKIAVKIIQDYFKENVPEIKNVDIQKTGETKKRVKTVDYGATSVMRLGGYNSYTRMTFPLSHYTYDTRNLFVYATVDDAIYLNYLEKVGESYLCNRYNEHYNTEYSNLCFVKLVKGAQNYVSSANNFVSVADMLSPSNVFWLEDLKRAKKIHPEVMKYYQMIIEMGLSTSCCSFISTLYGKIREYLNDVPNNFYDEDTKTFFNNLLSTIPDTNRTILEELDITQKDLDNLKKISILSTTDCINYTLYSLGITHNSEEYNRALTIQKLKDNA